jgi:DNA-binding transcriptional LysR family regulator
VQKKQKRMTKNRPSLSARSVLSPENLSLIATVARTGSMAAAARALGLVPSALTYRVRQIEDALDVLLFDRSARQAQITPAGAELLRSGDHLLCELDAVAERVKRVATGWEPQLTIVADDIISRTTLFELCEAFYALKAPTRLRLRSETLSGTMESLLSGKSDLALGVGTDGTTIAPAFSGVQTQALGEMVFVFAVAPHHPLALAPEPLPDALIVEHRAVAVADSTSRGNGLTFGLLQGQDVLTVPSMAHKIEAQLRGMACGHVPLPMIQHHLDAGHLIRKTVQRGPRIARVGYAWRHPNSHPQRLPGQALRWWLDQLSRDTTRDALLNRQFRFM